MKPAYLAYCVFGSILVSVAVSATLTVLHWALLQFYSIDAFFTMTVILLPLIFYFLYFSNNNQEEIKK